MSSNDFSHYKGIAALDGHFNSDTTTIDINQVKYPLRYSMTRFRNFHHIVMIFDPVSCRDLNRKSLN